MKSTKNQSDGMRPRSLKEKMAKGKVQSMEDNPHFLFIQNAYKWYKSLKDSDVPNDISILTILEEQHKLAILKAFKNQQHEK